MSIIFWTAVKSAVILNFQLGDVVLVRMDLIKRNGHVRNPHWLANLVFNFNF